MGAETLRDVREQWTQQLSRISNLNYGIFVLKFRWFWSDAIRWIINLVLYFDFCFFCYFDMFVFIFPSYIFALSPFSILVAFAGPMIIPEGRQKLVAALQGKLKS